LKIVCKSKNNCKYKRKELYSLCHPIMTKFNKFWRKAKKINVNNSRIWRLCMRILMKIKEAKGKVNKYYYETN
jgi:hypothetical protein